MFPNGVPFDMRRLENMVESFLGPMNEQQDGCEAGRSGRRHHHGPGFHGHRKHGAGHHGHGHGKHSKYGTVYGRSVAPQDIVSAETAYTLYFDVPGVAPGDVSVEIVNGILVVAGERKLAAASESQALRSERQGGAFRREWELPDDVFTDGISARLANGELVLTIPKQKQGERRFKVPIIYDGVVAPTPGTAAATQTPAPARGPANIPQGAPSGSATPTGSRQGRGLASAVAFASASSGGGRSNEVHVDVDLTDADWRDPSLTGAEWQARVLDPIIAAVAAARAANPAVYEDLHEEMETDKPTAEEQATERDAPGLSGPAHPPAPAPAVVEPTREAPKDTAMEVEAHNGAPGLAPEGAAAAPTTETVHLTEDAPSEDGSWSEVDETESEMARNKGKAPLSGSHVLEAAPAV